jgi:hypothetical protein
MASISGIFAKTIWVSVIVSTAMVYAPRSFAYGTAFKHFHQLVHLGSAFTAASAAHITNGLGRENKLTIGEHRRDVIGRSRAWAVNRAIFAREIFPRLRVRSLLAALYVGVQIVLRTYD